MVEMAGVAAMDYELSLNWPLFSIRRRRT